MKLARGVLGVLIVSGLGWAIACGGDDSGSGGGGDGGASSGTPTPPPNAPPPPPPPPNAPPPPPPPADAGDAGVDAASLGESLYVDPTTGDDANPGTMALPFKSISHAATVINMTDAGAGPFNLYLADATYSASNQPTLTVTFDNTTYVRGSSATNVILQGTGAGENLLFAQGGGAFGVKFKDTQFGVEAQHGAFSVGGCSFDGAGSGGYFASWINDSTGVFDTSGGATISGFTGSLGGVYIDNTASVTWNGGGTTNITGGGPGQNLIFMRTGGKLVIDGVNVTSYVGYVGVLYDQADLTWKNASITGSGWAAGVGGLTTAGAFYIGGSQMGVPSPKLTFDHANISGSLGNAIAVSSTTNTGTIAITATSSHFDSSTLAGIWANGNLASAAFVLSINATSSTFSSNGLPGIYAQRATVSLSGAGSAVSSNGAQASGFAQTPGGIVLTDSASTNSVTLRNVTLNANTGNAVDVNGAAGSKVDLGTGAAAGGVTFTAVPVGASALSVSAMIAATAVGDTWIPSIQGADGAGHFPTGTTITGPATGQNVTVAAGASVLLNP